MMMVFSFATWLLMLTEERHATEQEISQIHKCIMQKCLYETVTTEMTGTHRHACTLNPKHNYLFHGQKTHTNTLHTHMAFTVDCTYTCTQET